MLRVSSRHRDFRPEVSESLQAVVEGTLVSRPAGNLVIHSARVFDAVNGVVRPNHTVVVSGHRIESVAPTSPAVGCGSDGAARDRHQQRLRGAARSRAPRPGGHSGGARAAIRDLARRAGDEARSGTGADRPGKLADLVLVEEDHSRSISDIRRVRLVIKDGAVIDIDGLSREIGISPR